MLLRRILGNKESLSNWLSSLRDMAKRDLPIPTSITCDGAPGLIKAIGNVFPQSPCIWYWLHKMQKLQEKVPRESWSEARGELLSIRDARNHGMGVGLTQEFIEKYE
ncbi:MAG: transposase [Candidatus Atribacteria bacterium]|nr:transposase [Candidatus Atribacteria bacterium]